MLRPKSTTSAATSKVIVVLAFLCLMIAAIFGLVGSYKVDALRTEVASANAARDAAEQRRATQETELKARETAVAGEEAKIAEAQNKATKAGAELAQSQKETTELQTKLEAKQNEIASLQKRIQEAGAAKPSENPIVASTPEKQSILPPPPEIKAEPVEERTPPPQQPKRRKTSPAEAPGSELAQPRFRFLRRKPLQLSHPSPSIRSGYVRMALRAVEFALCQLIRRAAV